MSECAGLIPWEWLFLTAGIAFVAFVAGMMLMALMADAKARDKRAGRE